MGRKRRPIVIQNDREEPKHRDLKNIVKNTVRMFHDWIGKRTNPDKELERTLATMIHDHGRFNNTLMTTISKHPQLRQAFLTFC